MQGAEDFRQPLQVAIERRGGILSPRGGHMACRNEDEGGEGVLEHLRADMPPQYARGKV